MYFLTEADDYESAFYPTYNEVMIDKSEELTIIEGEPQWNLLN